jgi:hypothetical protein
MTVAGGIEEYFNQDRTLQEEWEARETSNTENIATSRNSFRNSARAIRLRTSHLDGFHAQTPPNSPSGMSRGYPYIESNIESNIESPIMSPSTFQSCHQNPMQMQIQDFNSFSFPQSKTFLYLFEQELLKIQEKFYSKDGEERMSTRDLSAVWKRIDYLESSILTLKELGLEGR